MSEHDSEGPVSRLRNIRQERQRDRNNMTIVLPGHCANQHQPTCYMPIHGRSKDDMELGESEWCSWRDRAVSREVEEFLTVCAMKLPKMLKSKSLSI